MKIIDVIRELMRQEQKPVEVKIQPLTARFQMPKKATDGSAAYDVFVPRMMRLEPGRQIIPLGFKVEIPEGYALDIRTRSGNAAKGLLAYDINGREIRLDADVLFGLIDSDYRGEVGVLLHVRDKRLHSNTYVLNMHQAIAQMKFCRVPDTLLVECTELSNTDRGTGGFGSTDNK